MLKREIKRNLYKYGKFLEPIGILFLFLIFALPIFSVVNLTPKSITPPSQRTVVLGVESNQQVEVRKVGGTHNYIVNERLMNPNAHTYMYYSTLLLREAGSYGKPIVQLKNPSDREQEVRFTITQHENSSTQIGIMRDNSNYILKDPIGYKFPRTFTLQSGEEMTFYLNIANKSDINFHEEIGLRIEIPQLVNIETRSIEEATENL